MSGMLMLGSGDAAPSSLLTGLAAWWGLHGAANAMQADASGNGRSMVPQGGALSSVPGLVGNAISFQGSTGYLLCSGAPIVSGSNFTISAWWKQHVPSADAWLFVEADAGSIVEGPTLVMSSGNITGTAGSAFAAGALAPAADTWFHALTTFDGTNCRIYLNGVLKVVAADSYPVGTLAKTAIGAFTDGTDGAAGVGQMIGVWTRALTDGGVSVGQAARGEVAKLAGGIDYPFAGA